MSELTDDQLDGLFRKSAEEFEPQFDPAAWQDMKSRLDSHDRTRTGGVTNWKNLLPWGIAVLLLVLLTGGSWYAYQKTKANAQPKAAPASRKSALASTKETTAIKDYQPESPRLVATNPHASPIGNSGQPKDEEVGREEDEAGRPANRAGLVTERSAPRSSSTEATNERTTTAAVLAKRATKPAHTAYTSINETSVLVPAKRIGKSTVVSKSGKTANRLRKLTGSTSSVSVAKRQKNRQAFTMFSTPDRAQTATPSFAGRQSRKRQQLDLQSTQSTSFRSESVSATEAVTNESKPVIELNELAIRPAHWPQPLTFVGRSVVEAPDTVTRKTVSIPTVPRGLSIRFAVAPDLSTVGLKNFSRPGTNIGLLLEYRLASRWSIQAGAVRSTKVYGATAGQYGYWPDYITKWPAKPIGVEGVCTIIDIPINVRYDVIIKPRLDNKLPSRWFVSTGVTSYVMKREDYTFDYSDYTRVNPNMLGESANTGGYGLSHLNFSVGYERAINRRLSWQVEPFMKVPLKGVGYFKIDLISTGAFFSIRYKLY